MKRERVVYARCRLRQRRRTTILDVLPDDVLFYLAGFLRNDDASRRAFVCTARRFHRAARRAFGLMRPFWHACQCDYAEVVEDLLGDARVDPAARHSYALRVACRRGHAGVVRLLLADRRADPTALRDCAIRLASKRGHTDVVRCLLADGRADPAASCNYAIRRSSQRGCDGVVRLLLADPRVDPCDERNAALRSSATFGHVSVLLQLLEDRRADPGCLTNDAMRYIGGRLPRVLFALLKDGRLRPDVVAYTLPRCSKKTLAQIAAAFVLPWCRRPLFVSDLKTGMEIAAVDAISRGYEEDDGTILSEYSTEDDPWDSCCPAYGGGGDYSRRESDRSDSEDDDAAVQPACSLCEKRDRG
jgi:hypothetical protein